MPLTYDRYYKNRKPVFPFLIWLIPVLLILMAGTGITVFILVKGVQSNVSENREIEQSYQQMFQDRNYLELIGKLDLHLQNDTFNQRYLIYRGFSYFLLSEDEVNHDKKIAWLQNSLIDLRRAMAIGSTGKSSGDIYFCIGKIYYYYGESFYKQSLQYLTKALATGSVRQDLYYLTGMVNSYLGDYQQAIDMFITAAEREESDLVFLAIGLTFYKMNDYENARRYIGTVLEKNPSDTVKEKSLFLLGEISYSEKKYLEALEYFDRVVALNENNAKAYFYRGEIYYQIKNPVRARSNWRKTLDIDPSHIRAKKRIYY